MSSSTLDVLTPAVREKALDVLEGMRQIVDAEMLIKGRYVSDESDPAKSNAVCGGHRYCAIGSLWAGYGIKPVRVDDDWVWREFRMPGTGGGRAQFVNRRPGLKLALEALNDAAGRYIAKNNLDRDELDPEHEFTDDIEALFEASVVDIGRPELLKIIASAKRSLKA